MSNIELHQWGIYFDQNPHEKESNRDLEKTVASLATLWGGKARNHLMFTPAQRMQMEMDDFIRGN